MPSKTHHIIRHTHNAMCRVAYCLTHASAVHAHPLAALYGVCLSWKDLKHLVLADRAAVDAGVRGCKKEV